MTEELKMPERQMEDGPVGVRRLDGNRLLIECGDDSLVVGEFNAWRIFGMFSLLLGIPLSKKVGKAIKF